MRLKRTYTVIYQERRQAYILAGGVTRKFYFTIEAIKIKELKFLVGPWFVTISRKLQKSNKINVEDHCKCNDRPGRRLRRALGVIVALRQLLS